MGALRWVLARTSLLKFPIRCLEASALETASRWRAELAGPFLGGTSQEDGVALLAANAAV